MRRKKRTDLLGWVIIIFVFLFLSAGIFVSFQLSSTEKRDPNTGCLLNSGPDSITVLLIDNTDKFNYIQRSDITNKINNEILSDLGINDLLIIYSMTDTNIEKNIPLVKKCSLPDGENANEFISNKRLIEKRKRELFTEPINKALSEALNSEEPSNTSPIMEMIQKIGVTDFGEYNKTSKNLFIISNLMQNSTNISFYKRFNINEFKKSKGYAALGVDLSGVIINIWKIRNDILRNSELIPIWEELLAPMTNALPNISEISG
jgi:hypothetical protein